MSPATKRVDPALLEEFCLETLKAVGVPASDSSRAAKVLVRTEQRGIASHGVQLLPHYLTALREGGCRANVSPELVRESEATALVDGMAGFGLVVASYASDLALEKASRSGIACVTVRNSNHFAAAGHYALSMAERGMISQVTSNASPVMAAAGSRTRAVSNAPTAYGVPAPEFPMVLDIAMSVTSGQKVRMAQQDGEKLAPGMIIDSNGSPSINPADFTEGGALLPIGYHKGYGLALATEVLSGALTGAHILDEVVSWMVNPGVPTGTGHCFVAWDPSFFGGSEVFAHRMQTLYEKIHALSTVDGVEGVLIPGELEYHREQASLEKGIAIGSSVWSDLLSTAGELGTSDLLNAARL